MEQRTTEWIEKVDLGYHERQFAEPYRSTVAFCDWLEKNGFIGKDIPVKILDLACGQGANLYYMGRRYPNSTFIGIDINPDIVKSGNEIFRDKGIANCHLEHRDLYAMPDEFVSQFQGIISFQTLSWLPEFREPVRAMSKLKADWIALSSLFYDGPLSCKIEVQDYDEYLKPRKESFYNIYSLPVVSDFFLSEGYSAFQSVPFEIDIDLKRPTTKGRGTYTEQLPNGHRLQFSGPLLLPWYFIATKRQ